MTMTVAGMQQQIDEALRRTEIDALVVALSAAQTQADVVQALCDFINFPRVTKVAVERNAALRPAVALRPAPKARKSRAKA